MHSHPPIFGLPTPAPLGQALRREHRAVAIAALQLRELLDGGFDWEELQETATDLLVHLDAHFEFEAQSGYLDAIAEIAPLRAAEVERVRRDHRELHTAFAALVSESHRALERDSIRAHAGADLAALADHERRENELALDTLFAREGGGD